MHICSISIHKALAGLDSVQIVIYATKNIFQSTRPSRASTHPRRVGGVIQLYFNPQGPRGPRRIDFVPLWLAKIFQSTRPSRASTQPRRVDGMVMRYFNPQGPRGPRLHTLRFQIHFRHFNPQGPRGPRRHDGEKGNLLMEFQSTRPSRASTDFRFYISYI